MVDQMTMMEDLASGDLDGRDDRSWTAEEVAQLFDLAGSGDDALASLTLDLERLCAARRAGAVLARLSPEVLRIALEQRRQARLFTRDQPCLRLLP